MNIRILHVDDEPDIREIANISLSLNPEFEVKSCASGPEALAAATEWQPGLILLDVMMPGMDGPMTLGELRKKAETGNIPVIFVTARAQAREIEHFVSLGAEGVISKPFDPMKLAFQVSGILQGIRMAKLRTAFRSRAKADAEKLLQILPVLLKGNTGNPAEQIRDIAHSLAGAAGIHGYDLISRNASLLEDATLAFIQHKLPTNTIERALKILLADLESIGGEEPHRVNAPHRLH
jgi:CheY-like chemotaxis protein